MIIKVQQGDFDVAEINRQMLGERCDVGAITSFTGLVRDLPGDGLQTMTLEHYPGMTEKSLCGIVEKAQQRWDIIDCAVIHRVGELKPSDQIVLVSVLSAHRTDAFAACEFIMDYLKTEAPFWKKETNSQNSQWVEAKSSDNLAKNRWDSDNNS
ncbi:MAG: molybdenum cofactor biosynthesis protein MoaE [Gammaproteobacteria bacterium]|nr:molybdenum cofactor biosynthesis protein MoaE [Gammaproteobacteria bacterium]